MNWIDQIAGLFSAVAGALGLGGGGVLVLYLTLGMHVPQLRAQGINLLFFLPCALVSILMNWKKKLIHWKSVIPMALGGLAGVGLGTWLAGMIKGEWLGKLFGGFLLIVGLIELFGKPKKKRNPKITLH